MSPKSVVTARAKLGNRRVTGKEQYYTPRELASVLVSKVKQLVPDFSSRTVLEPAGGTGAFVEAAKAAGAKKVLSVDIEPKHGDVNKADYLSTNLNLVDAVTISNPPFGRNNSLSIPFFNRAADTSEFIAFIVPRSWRKWSVINRLDRRFPGGRVPVPCHTVPEQVVSNRHQIAAVQVRVEPDLIDLINALLLRD